MARNGNQQVRHLVCCLEVTYVIRKLGQFDDVDVWTELLQVKGCIHGDCYIISKING